MPLTLVCSGPLTTRGEAVGTLVAGGFTFDDQHGDRSWGHPSYRNPVEAAAAGAPNSGHTPDGPHPDTGEVYVPDPRISFVTVMHASDDVNVHSAMLGAVADDLEALDWVLRGHWSKIRPAIRVDGIRQLHELMTQAGKGR